MLSSDSLGNVGFYLILPTENRRYKSSSSHTKYLITCQASLGSLVYPGCLVIIRILFLVGKEGSLKGFHTKVMG